METEYCKGCGQKLPNKILGMITGQKAYAFEDGFYCEKCAKLKLKEIGRNYNGI